VVIVFWINKFNLQKQTIHYSQRKTSFRKMKNKNNHKFITIINNERLSIPKQFILTACDYNVGSYHDNLFYDFNVHCPESIKRSVTKRQAEYLAGRLMASHSLSKLHHPNVDVPIGKNRKPEWPKKLLGSITHTHTQAACIIAHENDAQYIGIDLENIASRALANEIKSNVITKQEEQLLADSDLQFEPAFTLAFSAKESLFKALYPKVNDYFDFSSAQITTICTKKNTFEVALTKTLSNSLTVGERFHGRFDIDKHSVLTLIIK